MFAFPVLSAMGEWDCKAGWALHGWRISGGLAVVRGGHQAPGACGATVP